MSRRHLDKPSASVIAAFAANVAAIFILPPPLFVYLVVVDLFAGFIAVVGMYLAADQRAEIAEHRALQAEIGEEIAQDLLDRYRRDARVVVPIKPALRVIPGDAIPTQRTPESAEVSDYSWPKTARQIEHDDLTALIRATEE